MYYGPLEYKYDKLILYDNKVQVAALERQHTTKRQQLEKMTSCSAQCRSA